MQAPIPISITYGTTTTGARYAIAQFPVTGALQARHMPNIIHKGITYAPYTGERRRGSFYLEYRALRQHLQETTP